MTREPCVQTDTQLTLLFSREAIAARVRELAAQISRDYAGRGLVLVGVLKGAFVFLADLMRQLQVPVEVEFVRLASTTRRKSLTPSDSPLLRGRTCSSPWQGEVGRGQRLAPTCTSYGKGTTSTGHVRLIQDLEHDIAGRDVLIVEDMLDTGLTLHSLVQQLRARQPASLKVCVFLHKETRTLHPFSPDYVGFTGVEGFVVGYGIDYAEQYRHLPDIYRITQVTSLAPAPP